MNETIHIYALRCPVDGKIHYVGKSSNPRRRLKSHLNDQRNALKKQWLIMLKERGLEPTIEILDSVSIPADPSIALEKTWIERLRDEGQPLINNHDRTRSMSMSVRIDMDKLKELRRRRVMTIEQLAAKAGVSKNTISKAERGGSVYPSSIHKIATALGVEPSELM